MTCYILLQDGSGYLRLQDDTGNVLLQTCDDAETGGLPYIDPFTQKLVSEHKRAKERQRIKEEEIIRLRVEAQEAWNRKRELSDAQDKQTRRQIAAADAEYNRLMTELMAQVYALELLSKAAQRRRNALTMVLLQAASPFSPLTFH